MLIAVLLGAIYLPFNMVLTWLGPIVHRYWREKKYGLFIVTGILFAPFWVVTAILSAPYELMVEHMH